MKSIQIIEQRELLGKQFRIYGTPNQPLFLVTDVADWIDNIAPQTSEYIEIDTTEIKNEIIDKSCIYDNEIITWKQECSFLTEIGLYQVLMQSRKPIARKFERRVKIILECIRENETSRIKSLLNDPDFLSQLITKLEYEKEARMKASNY